MVHVAGSFWSYHYSKNHFSTDDAQVTGHLHPVTSRIAHLTTIGIPLSQISGLSYRLIESRLLPQAAEFQ